MAFKVPQQQESKSWSSSGARTRRVLLRWLRVVSDTQRSIEDRRTPQPHERADKGSGDLLPALRRLRSRPRKSVQAIIGYEPAAAGGAHAAAARAAPAVARAAGPDALAAAAPV